MLRIIASCGSVPALYLRSNRDAPSALHGRGDLPGDGLGRADVERARRDLAVVLGPAGRAPAALGADPVPHHLVVAARARSRACASVSAMWPGEWMPTGSVGRAELGEGAVVELDVGREAARVAADDGERERKAVAGGAHHLSRSVSSRSSRELRRSRRWRSVDCHDSGAPRTSTLTPATALDAGSFRVDSLLALNFQGLGTTGTIFLDDSNAPANDDFVYEGTSGTDTFAVSATAVVTLNGRTPVNLLGDTDHLTLQGFAGDDRSL